MSTYDVVIRGGTVVSATGRALLELGRILARLDAPCLVHCEDDRITAHDERRLRAEGRTDGGIIPAWRSREAELVSVAEVATVARLTGARLVIAHASSADVLDLLARERAAGAPVLAETCPQYLHLREAEVHEHGALRKFTPPARIRSGEDETRMWAALSGGLVHHLSSDHAPATLATARPQVSRADGSCRARAPSLRREVRQHPSLLIRSADQPGDIEVAHELIATDKLD